MLQVCIFAYGQTGSGKTYTMFGNADNRGIIPRAMAQVGCANCCKHPHKKTMQRVQAVQASLSANQPAFASFLFILSNNHIAAALQMGVLL